MESFEEHYASMCDAIKKHLPGADMALIDRAVDYANQKHKLQKRKDGSPYIIHPLAVAQIVAEMGLDCDAILGALLHDCIEDTDASHEDIEKIFGPTVAELVEGVTKLTRANFSSSEQAQMENLRKMFMAMSKDIRVVLIKIADRLHNMRTMQYQTPEKQIQKCRETMDVYAPLAHRLGMQKIKWELEDTSLRYLAPMEYNEIMSYLQAHKEKDEAFMRTIQDKITQRLTSVGIHNTTYGRIKHVYSIYRKMLAQGKTIDELYDIYAFRVIVDTIPDCYNVLGHVHDLFSLVPGRFKDYISTPKPNMYQSLHTTVIGSQGIPFEVQIRTWQMHETAEYGIAAHWKYKQGTGTGTEKDFEWVRRLLESQQDSDAEEFVQSMKIDMFDDEVFVYTPKGRIVSLPAGSTPIDFAYAIHSGVGNSMIGAKVNNRIANIDTTLKNGDIVEVLTSKSAKGPSRDWLKIAKTQQAKAKIRTWFKKANREENIQRGKDMLSEALKRQGAQLSEFTGKKEYFEDILKKFNMSDLDDVYASIGYGGITTGQVTNKLLEQAKKEAKAAAAAERLERLEEEQQSRPENRGNGKGVIVEGDTGMVVRFARCCTPLPGDDIIGYVTRGRGVSIHRKDCPNIGDLLMDPERVVRAEWANNAKSSYTATIQVVADERTGLLMDVSQVLAGMNISITAMTAKVDKANQSIIQIQLSFDVSSTEQLNNIIKSMRKVRSVKEVYRVNQ